MSEEPETTAGSIHIAVSLISFVLVLAGILTLTAAFGRAAAWRSLRPLSLVLGLAALGAFVVSGAAQDASWWGASQRIFVGLVLLWLLIIADRLRTRGSARAA